jgi:hypothetical protein
MYPTTISHGSSFFCCVSVHVTNYWQDTCTNGTALVRVAEPIALTSILPYAWKLVSNFNVGSESNAPFFAGLLISVSELQNST